MRSTSVKLVRNILSILGIIGAIFSGMLFPSVRVANYDIRVTSYNWSALIGSLLSVAFLYFMFSIFVTLLENQEIILEHLFRVDPQNKEDILTKVKADIPSYSAKDRNKTN